MWVAILDLLEKFEGTGNGLLEGMMVATKTQIIKMHTVQNHLRQVLGHTAMTKEEDLRAASLLNIGQQSRIVIVHSLIKMLGKRAGRAMGGVETMKNGTKQDTIHPKLSNQSTGKLIDFEGQASRISGMHVQVVSTNIYDHNTGLKLANTAFHLRLKKVRQMSTTPVQGMDQDFCRIKAKIMLLRALLIFDHTADEAVTDD